MKRIKTCLFYRDRLKETKAAFIPLHGTDLAMGFTLPGRDFPELASREDMEKVLGSSLEKKETKAELKEMALKDMPYQVKKFGYSPFYIVRALYDEGYGTAAILHREVQATLDGIFPDGYFVILCGGHWLLAVGKEDWESDDMLKSFVLKPAGPRPDGRLAGRGESISGQVFTVKDGRLVDAGQKERKQADYVLKKDVIGKGNRVVHEVPQLTVRAWTKENARRLMAENLCERFGTVGILAKADLDAGKVFIFGDGFLDEISLEIEEK